MEGECGEVKLLASSPRKQKKGNRPGSMTNFKSMLPMTQGPAAALYL